MVVLTELGQTNSVNDNKVDWKNWTLRNYLGDNLIKKWICLSFLERKIEFYSHFEEKGEYVWTTEELVIVRDCVEIDIRRMVIIHRWGSNSHSITETSTSTNSATTASLTDH